MNRNFAVQGFRWICCCLIFWTVGCVSVERQAERYQQLRAMLVASMEEEEWTVTKDPAEALYDITAVIKFWGRNENLPDDSSSMGKLLGTVAGGAIGNNQARNNSRSTRQNATIARPTPTAMAPSIPVMTTSTAMDSPMPVTPIKPLVQTVTAMARTTVVRSIPTPTARLTRAMWISMAMEF